MNLDSIVDVRLQVVRMVAENWALWSLRIEPFKQEGRAPGTGGAALAVWFPRAVTLASPPGKDGGDDRAPGHSE